MRGANGNRETRCDVDAAGAAGSGLRAALARDVVAAAMSDALASARSCLAAGDAKRAAALLGPLAEATHAGRDVLMLYGYALMGLGRRDAAEAAFRRCVEADTGDRDASLRLAAVLADNDKPVAAEAIARADIAAHGRSPAAAFVLGRALLGQARFDAAEAEFRDVVRSNPQHQVAQANLMELVWTRTGDVRAAARSLDALLLARPALVWPRLVKARLLVSAGRAREASSVLEAGLAVNQADASLLVAAASIALEFDADLALKFALQAARVAPDTRAARMSLGNAWLATGQAGSALDLADGLLRAHPADGEALALRADALRLAGDACCRELLDYGHFVRAETIAVPDGWPDLAAYLSDLAGDLDSLHADRKHPVGNSLRGGSQVQLTPVRSSSAAIRAFPRAVDGSIRRYIRALGTGLDPMRARSTGRYAFNGMWSVRLRPNGFHVTHYHPKGWISSACYLRLPRAVAAHRGEGWLKFGEPAFATRPALPPEYFVKPEPGLLVLFPAYMWHGTVPFSGDAAESRLTIAFDVVPG